MRYLDMEQYLEEMNDMQKNSNKQPTMIGTKKGLIAFYNGAKELPSFAKLFCNIESINEDHVCVNNGFNGEDSIPFFRRISWTDISENGASARPSTALAVPPGRAAQVLHRAVLRPPGPTDAFSLVRLHCAEGHTVVAAGTARGEVCLWRLQGPGSQGPWGVCSTQRLAVPGRPVLDLYASGHVTCVLDSWTVLSVFDIAAAPADSLAQQPAYTLNALAHMQPHEARFGSGCDWGQIAVDGDVLCFGPQILTAQLQLLRLTAASPPRLDLHKYGPVWQMRCFTVSFSCLLLLVPFARLVQCPQACPCGLVGWCR